MLQENVLNLCIYLSVCVYRFVLKSRPAETNHHFNTSFQPIVHCFRFTTLKKISFVPTFPLLLCVCVRTIILGQRKVIESKRKVSGLNDMGEKGKCRRKSAGGGESRTDTLFDTSFLVSPCRTILPCVYSPFSFSLFLFFVCCCCPFYYPEKPDWEFE